MPRTAVKRAQILLRYFCMDTNAVSRLGTWDRSWCLKYLGAVGSHGVPASKGTTLLEALSFSEVCDGHANSRGPDFRSSVERQSATSLGLQGVLQTCEASQGQ